MKQPMRTDEGKTLPKRNRCREEEKQRPDRRQTTRARHVLGVSAREPTFHRIRVHQTGLLELKAAASENGEIGDALNLVP
jgi:hypothetical protein